MLSKRIADDRRRAGTGAEQSGQDALSPPQNGRGQAGAGQEGYARRKARAKFA